MIDPIFNSLGDMYDDEEENDRPSPKNKKTLKWI